MPEREVRLRATPDVRLPAVEPRGELLAAPAPIYVVRHARALERDRWPDNDRLRPLTKGGRRQADALVALVPAAPTTPILSSPYRRCLETVAPLALRCGVPVETSMGLEVGADPHDALALIRQVAVGSVLCSHADIILALLEYLAGQGVLRPSEVRAEKGAVWMLQRVDGHISHARYVRNPA